MNLLPLLIRESSLALTHPWLVFSCKQTEAILLATLLLPAPPAGGQGHHEAGVHAGRHDLPGLRARHHLLLHEGEAGQVQA